MSSNLGENMRNTTENYVLAFNGRWNADRATVYLAPECQHIIIPASFGVPKKNNEEWVERFKKMEKLGIDGKMVIEDYIGAPNERRAVCRSTLTASTPVGEYSNDYIWFLTFNESGDKLVEITESLNPGPALEFFKRLADAGYYEYGNRSRTSS